MVLLIIAGFHVPVIPLVEEAGNVGGTVPTQKAAIWLNKGFVFAFTVITIDAVSLHPPEGVKIYVDGPMIELLTVAGFHVPVIPLVEEAGNVGATVPTQKAPIWLNKGFVFAVTLMTIEAVSLHPPEGVKIYVDGPMIELLTVAGFHVPAIPFVDEDGKIGAAVPTQKAVN